jgi:hypothetical protein
VNIDSSADNTFYHGTDIDLFDSNYQFAYQRLNFYLHALDNYELFHFANAHGLYFIPDFDTDKSRIDSGLTHRFFEFLFNKVLKWKLNNIYRLVYLIGIKRSSRILSKYKRHLPERWDILLMRKLGKKIVYTNNGCMDGVSQSVFSKWSTPDGVPICDICAHKNKPEICCDERNRKWSIFRNAVTDYQFHNGGNKIEYNLASQVHDVPGVYCMDSNFWSPDILVPSNYLLPFSEKTVKIYHAIGNYESRSQLGKVTIKSTHIYIPLIEKLRKMGLDTQLIVFNDVPNKLLRYYQVQADIVVDMLTFGFFGATIREGLMLGKTCVCYLRPEWMEAMRKENPEYIEELPVVNANPNTIEEILKELIANPEKRIGIGKKSRAFAMKWHSKEAGAKKVDEIYKSILGIHG